ADGAARLLLWRAEVRGGRWVGLHRHPGDEAVRVLSGAVHFFVGGEQRVGRAGDLAVIPPDVEHAWLVLRDSVLEVLGGQRRGELVVALAPDGTRREVEVFGRGALWRKAPPAGAEDTPAEAIQALYDTTRQLLRDR